jgi:TPR repeat protein
VSPEQRAESQRLINRADSILRNTNDIAAARLFLERAAGTGDGQAFFRLAETYDPDWLAQQRARGVSGDLPRARALYQRAADLGVPAARIRLGTLR